MIASLLLLLPLVPAEDPAGLELFEAEVRPLLHEHCVSCHGPEKARAGLRLDGPAGLRAGGARGSLVVPGDPEASWLLRAVGYEEHELQMPPRGRLPEADLEILRTWVERGAPMPDGTGARDVPPGAAGEAFDLEARARAWCFQPIVSPAPPEVSNAAWPAGDVDRFLLAAMEAAGVAPGEDADLLAVARRASFDLTGLPPRRGELEELLARSASDGAEHAYRDFVDRLLASDAYGERWARHWLDLVRYAESRGHEFDYTMPNAFEYRDYVIRAFREDVPYDRFLIEHLAGDLVQEPRPNATAGWDESVLGTASWFLGDEVHSPVDLRADEMDRAANKIDVLSKTFLGLTVACARCHDHKFDPISQADFYALAGYVKSSHYRQVRFETREHNGRIAELLRALREEARPRVIEEWREGVREHFRDLELVLTELVRARETVADVYPRRPDWVDVVFTDFEAETWPAGWVVEGEVFGPGPIPEREAPGHEGRFGQRGERLLYSYFRQGAERIESGDGPTGTLTSAEFTIERDFVHLLVAGGDFAGETCVQLVIGGEVRGEVTGSRSNRLAPRRFDVSRWRGARARLRFVDGRTDSWGHIGCDRIVFSDMGDADLVLRGELSDRELVTRALTHELVAQRTATKLETVRAWDDELRDPESPLAALSTDAEPQPPTASRPRVLDVPRALADARDDGYGWSSLRSGELLLTTGAAVGAVVARGDGLVADPLWDDLALAPGTQAEPGRIRWLQPGRTLFTPSFTLGSGKLSYLVTGAGDVHASIGAHRMNEGPLHGRLLRGFDVGTGARWIEHDLSEYAGEVCHLEFTSRAGAREGLQVLRVVEESPAGIPREPDAPRGRDLAGSGSLLAALAPFREELDRALAEFGAWSSPRRAELGAWMLRAAAPRSPAFDAYRERELALRTELQLESRTAPALIDGSGVDELLLVRGNPRTPGDVVPRRSLEVFGSGPESGPGSGRLELARRLVAPDNPLVSRVWVNRVWHHLFGRGLVSTVDDFGVMGEEPTHPELLDHLASGLRNDGWSTKRLIRRIVLSRAYRLSSRATAEMLERDPTNRLYQRADVRRLSAEALRDAVLCASGTLDETSFGPPVPVHLTEFMQGRGRPSSGPLDGAGRRSIYLSVRRNFLSPFFLVFDYPSPMTTVGRRTSSNVPAQALAMLNDPFVLQEAERLAGRLPDGSPEERVADLYWRLVGRPPTREEVSQALSFLSDAPDEGWSALCHVGFNLKEFLYLR